jgi:hypothetical protein
MQPFQAANMWLEGHLLGLLPPVISSHKPTWVGCGACGQVGLVFRPLELTHYMGQKHRFEHKVCVMSTILVDMVFDCCCMIKTT